MFVDAITITYPAVAEWVAFCDRSQTRLDELPSPLRRMIWIWKKFVFREQVITFSSLEYTADHQNYMFVPCCAITSIEEIIRKSW
jgi:hypothetical protein